MNSTTLPQQFHDEMMLTTEQVAAITGVSKKTFEAWRAGRSGGPKFKKLGPQLIRYRWADVRAWRDQYDEHTSAA